MQTWWGLIKRGVYLSISTKRRTVTRIRERTRFKRACTSQNRWKIRPWAAIPSKMCPKCPWKTAMRPICLKAGRASRLNLFCSRLKSPQRRIKRWKKIGSNNQCVAWISKGPNTSTNMTALSRRMSLTATIRSLCPTLAIVLTRQEWPMLMQKIGHPPN